MNLGHERRFLHGVLAAFALVFVFGLWYVYAPDYSYSALSGTYVLTQGTSSDTITLRKTKPTQKSYEAASITPRPTALGDASEKAE